MASENDCYFQVSYKYGVSEHDVTKEGWTLRKYRQELRRFLESTYYDNDASFTLKLCTLHCAFKAIPTARMLFEIGHGGDGKGMLAILEANVLGAENAGSLDCAVFVDRNEFRKSGHFAWNKATVRVQD